MRGLNLLPWRQERRRKQQQVRLSMVGVIAGCAVICRDGLVVDG
ncbi:MAG: hypothetical protein Ct9H300mP13_2560 [Gammaproteobacteria bacterium]|nr:MAG: hypothetical protein Ct9H300mP13_2560 [Gammaproteobacteria bacterium]